MKPEIIIADDHKLFNNGLKQLLSDDFNVIAQIYDGRDVIPTVLLRIPQLIILDINLPNIKGLEIGKELKRSYENLKVVFITMYSESAFIKAAKDNNADGYILKESESDYLIKSLKSVLDGAKVFDNKLDTSVPNLHHDDFFVKEYSLSKREVEIIGLIRQGSSTSQIATALFVSDETVKSHRKNIFFKLGINKSSELIKFAIEKGI
jgi:DNA-binding NarL/FixJ family response regulator